MPHLMLDYSVKVFLLHVFRVIFKDGVLGDATFGMIKVPSLHILDGLL